MFRSPKKRLRLLSLLLPLLLGMTGLEAGAETPRAVDAGELERLVSEARAEGAKVIVIEVPAGAGGGREFAAQPAILTRVQERALQARARFREILAGVGAFPVEAGETIRRHDPSGSAAWPLTTILFVVLFLAIGHGVERVFHLWARPQFQRLFHPTPESHAEKISYLLLRGTMQLFGVVIQVGTALLLALAFDQGLPHVRSTHLIVIGAVGAVRGLSVFFRNLLASDTPSHRLLNLSNADASRLHRSLLGLLTIIATAGSLCVWMDSLDLDRNAHLLSLMGATLLSALLIASLAIWQRRAVAGMILGVGESREKPLFLRFLAGTWHVLALVYLVLAWSATSVRLVLGESNALGLVGSPILILFMAIAVYGCALLVIEWAFMRRAGRLVEATGALPAEVTEDTRSASGRRVPTFKSLAQRAAALIVAALAFWSVLNFWGVGLVKQGSALAGLWEILLVAFLAYLGFESVKIAIDRKIEEEGGYHEPEPGEEGGAKGASRLATLLPLFRNCLLIVIAVIAGMIVLSELGVDIAPLFAGAGVVGLAVGFGAQTLIRDIFSGAFFLMDDAFRKGEYIDIGSVKGTVERISIRSLQLRHHKGPLHTIPFGEIQHLTNYSRDWVMMKLPLRVTYDTDVEKVRKLIKNLGKELLKEPEIGETFLQPLKSQGVYQMEDSAMIIRVKFMTRPGDQFQARKLVYAKIRELFAKEGIKFAHREVTVRVAETPHDRPLTDQEKEAVAGAVRPMIEEDQAPASGSGER
jgi:small-conductance mechanosensitive channel